MVLAVYTCYTANGRDFESAFAYLVGAAWGVRDQNFRPKYTDIPGTRHESTHRQAVAAYRAFSNLSCSGASEML